MKKLPTIIVMITALACSTTAYGDKQLSPLEASKSFQEFVDCAVKRNPDRVEELLRDADFKYDEIAKLAKKNAHCLQSGRKLTAPAILYRGGFASAYMVKRFKDSELPDYSDTPLVAATIPADCPPNQARRYVLSTFVECVYRNNPSLVIDLLSTRVGSSEEKAKFEELMPHLQNCLPFEQGQQVKFTAIHLRSMLGEAAFAVQNAWQNRASGSREKPPAFAISFEAGN